MDPGCAGDSRSSLASSYMDVGLANLLFLFLRVCYGFLVAPTESQSVGQMNRGDQMRFQSSVFGRVQAICQHFLVRLRQTPLLLGWLLIGAFIALMIEGLMFGVTNCQNRFQTCMEKE